MKTNNYIKSFVLALGVMLGASLFVLADGARAPMAEGGGLVPDDPDAVVANGSYVTFSTLFDGKRYYLGVDTVLAKEGKDTVTYYEGPGYATMWVVGPNWSPTGEVLENKDYARTIKSVWLKEKVNRDRYLALGTGTGTYSTLRLLETGTMWHTEKDSREQNRYINGYLYYYSDATGIDVYRYLRYDPVYGFSRLYAEKTANSQRVSVWDRKTGSDLIFAINPNTFTFGYETNGKDTTKFPITSQVIYYENVDRFRSRVDHVDVYAARSEPITDQTLLADPNGPYKLFGYYEWKSNPLGEGTQDNVAAYNGLSRMKVYMPVLNTHGSANPEVWTYEMGWGDSTMVYVKEDGFKLENNIWYDTVYAIGSAPVDRPNARFLRKPADDGAPTEGSYANHNDVLYVKFQCHGQSYIDSISVSRHTFHNAPYTTMNTRPAPTDTTFSYTYNNKLVDGTTPVASEDTACTFTVSASYIAGNRVINAVNAVVSNYVGEEMTLNLADPSMSCIRDTIWEYDEDGNPVLDDDDKPVFSDVILYDTLIVEALLADGVTNAVYGAEGSSGDSWIESVRLTDKNKIRVKVKQSDPSVEANRVAQIRYTYRYWHSSAKGDQVTSSHTIWIVQKWSGADNDLLYSFNHKGPLAENGLQAVYEKKVTMYAIPEEDLALPLHRDLWGYYRWFVYDGAAKDRDVANDGTWSYVTPPKNHLGNEFIPINITTSPTSRGQWDMAIGDPSHFTLNTSTQSPVIRNDKPANNSIKVACDVSAYKDIEHVGEIGVSLTSVTEPTLSYRQVFDVQPAKTQADKMADCRVNGDVGHNGYMETHTVVAPAGRALTLSPQYPIAAGVSTSTEPAYTEDELKYIYYFNPNIANNTDPNMGTKGTLDASKAASYCRIGQMKTTGDTRYRARLMTASEVKSLSSSKKVVMVNPHLGHGYVLGKNGTGFAYSSITSIQDTASLRAYVENSILNPGGNPNPQDAYVLKLDKSGGNTYIVHNSTGNNLTYSWQVIRYSLDWSDHLIESGKVTIVDYSSSTDDGRIPNAQGAMVKIQMGILLGENHHLTAANYTERTRAYTNNLHVVRSNGTEGVASNQGWLFYEIIDPTELVEHRETPRWEKSTDGGSSWTEVARWDYSTNSPSTSTTAGYSMRPDGSLEIENTVRAEPNETILYRLRTEHFYLLYMPLVLRDPDKEGPKEGAPIISEDDIEANYTVLFDLGMDQWPKPGTNSVVAHTQPMPWDFTEMSFHYPSSVIPNAYRDTITEMPLKGEYALLNKFVVPAGGKNTLNEGVEYEARAGAANGYMMVLNADNKRTTIMRFDYPTLSCSNQQIYLVGDYCNPVNNSFEPQITADLEGSNDGVTWTEIYRFKTGKIPYNKDQPWYQMALPIDREKIKGYKTFRCSAMLDGATNKNAHLLVDRLRFIERTRSFNVFQSKAACVKDDSVSVLLRVDYTSDPELYQPGKLVAYQLQKWNAALNDGEGGYEAMTYSQVKPGYVKDGFTVAEGPNLKSLAGNDYGYVYIPEATYDPSLSSTTPSTYRTALVTQAADSLVKWGLLAEGDKAARINNFKNETGNVVSYEEVMSENTLFGGATPHIKSYVREGDKWVVYIACRLKASETQNGIFRVGMTVMNGLDDKPTFIEESCASFRLLNIKETTALLLDGEIWPNYTREQIEASDTDDKELLAANETYRASIRLNVPEFVNGKLTKNPRCKFDLLHASAAVRPNTTEGNDAFLARYGCTRDKFVDAMSAFRSDDEDNPMRIVTDWSKVKPADFSYAGRSAAECNEIYTLLNGLVQSGLLELGLDYRDIYMGDRKDSWFYLIPVPASGLFDLTHGNAAGTADTTLDVSVCNDTLWLQLHSEEPEYKLRYGYDSRVGDTYIVPTVRASKTDANGTLNVRIAYLTGEAEKATVIGHDSTRLVETNDPDWTAADLDKAVYYSHDKNVLSPAANLDDYYNTGDTVHFTKHGLFTLKAGYWYRFESAFFGTTTPGDDYEVDETDPAHVKGHTSFILAVAPDTVRWTPAHPDAANYWNDDANWTAIVNGAPKADVAARVPMADTRVIIPQVAEGLLPIASDYVVDSKDTLHFGYAKNTCKEILFKPQATILGQEKLDYKKALVDLRLVSGTWQTFSPALEHIYSGDIYIPADPGTADASDFAPGTFSQGEGSSWTSNPRVWPYAFYQGFYNSSVPVAFYNTDEEDRPVATTTAQSKNSVDWVRSNVLDMHYKPGAACVLNGYGPSDADGEELIIRLPKQEAQYCGYGKNPDGSGYIAGTAVTMQEDGTPRPAFNALEHNLAYDKTALEGKDGIGYTLHNEVSSDIFFFGNPTMSLIDVYTLCVDNASVLKHEDGTYHFTAYQLIDGSNYTVKQITGHGQYFIAPQRAVGLIAKAPANELTITLKPDALVAINGEGTIVNEADVRGGASPVRRRAKAEAPAGRRFLHMAAANRAQDRWDGETLAKAYITLGEYPAANRGFKDGEDALAIASGLNYYSDYSFSTPLSVYSIADNRALMLDIRDTLSMVPLAFTTLDEKYTFSEYTVLSFALEGDWNEPLYLFDAVENDSIRIVDGLQIAVATPLSDQLRYYINGTKRTNSSGGQYDTPTGLEIVNDQINDQMVNAQMVNVYDVLGRKVAVLGENDLLTNRNLPTGVYIISRGTKTERVVIR